MKRFLHVKTMNQTSQIEKGGKKLLLPLEKTMQAELGHEWELENSVRKAPKPGKIPSAPF